MISAVKALTSTVAGTVTLGLAYTVGSHELHYWTTPAHLPIALTVAAGLTAAGVGGTSVWAKGKLEERKERKASEELADLREQMMTELPQSSQSSLDERLAAMRHRATTIDYTQAVARQAKRNA